MHKHSFKWCIVGAGPAGIATIGLLLDAGVEAKDILWLDLDFQGGDFGKYWGEVGSNTTVKLFNEFLTGIKSFQYMTKQEDFPLDSLPADGFCKLQQVAASLNFISRNLQKKVSAIKTWVEELVVKDGFWQLQTKDGSYRAKKSYFGNWSNTKTLIC